MQLTISPVRDASGEVIGASTIARDVTDRRRAERELQQLASSVQAGVDAVVSWDLEGRIRRWNVGAERLYGWTAQEAIGRRGDELSLTSDQLAERLAQMRANEFVSPQEVDRRRKDGSIIRLLNIVLPWRVDGEVVGMTSIAFDLRRTHATAALTTRRSHAR